MKRRAPLGYLVLCAAFAAGMVVQTWEHRWSGDQWAHRAAVLELSHDPWSPDHPFTGSHDEAPELSPYTLVLGLTARFSGLGVSEVLSVAALVNLMLFLIGLQRFVNRFSQAPLAPFWALLGTLFVWGLSSPWRWSGYLNANSIGFGLPYPSMFATALLLFALSALLDFCDGRDRCQLAALGVLTPLIVLSHPFTGAALGVAGLSVLVSRSGVLSARMVVELAAALAAAAVAVLAWPLYSVFDLLGASAQYDGVHADLYRLVGLRAGLALVAVPVLALRFRADRRDPLALIVGGATLIFVLGGLTGRYSLGRIMPLGMLGLHVALGVWLAERAPVLWRQGTRAQRLGSAVAGAVLLAAGVVSCRAGLARTVPAPILPSGVAGDPRLDTNDGALSFISRETSVDDIAFVRTLEAARVAPALGAKVVAPGYVAPFVDDIDRRRAAVAQFFTSASFDQRRALIDGFGVSFVLFDLRFDKPDVQLGTVVHHDDRYVLMVVRDSR